MSYINVITLATAKNYLRVDDTLTTDDADITRMINSSLSFIEDYTNVIVYARSKEYLFQNCETRVYDYPINSLTTPNDAVKVRKSLYSIYTATASTDEILTLNVGHTLPADVPSGIVDVALEMIDIAYYGQKEDGANNKRILSQQSMDILNKYKRYLL